MRQVEEQLKILIVNLLKRKFENYEMKEESLPKFSNNDEFLLWNKDRSNVYMCKFFIDYWDGQKITISLIKEPKLMKYGLWEKLFKIENKSQERVFTAFEKFLKTI